MVESYQVQVEARIAGDKLVRQSIKSRTSKIGVLGGWAPKGEGGVVPQRTMTTEPRRPPHTTPRFKPVQDSIYFGASNLDPKLGRWLSEDPALLEYLPVPEINDDAKKHNGQLPGMGGVFNAVNLNLWHYGGNNPIKYVDPTGRFFGLESLWRRLFWKGTEAGTQLGSAINQFNSYMSDTTDSLIQGDFKPGTTTGLAIAINALAGFVGIDAPADIRDLAANASDGNWLGAAFSGIGLIPIIGGLKNLKHADEVLDVGKGLTRSLDDLPSLRGASPEEIAKIIPEGWVSRPARSGDGTRYLNPDKPGEAIIVEKGWPGATDPLHSGPYVRISRNGTIERIPLAGNPVLGQ